MTDRKLELKSDFIKFALSSNVLRFGEFKTKAGRLSPYFFYAGLFDTGERLRELGNFYAQAILESGISFDMLYGPAYKGIPLSAATAIGLANRGVDTPFAFNRKEAKDHGEGGTTIGAPLAGRVLVIDDVVSAGTSVRESVDIISASGASVCGIVVCLDRQEKGTGERSAIQEIEEDLQIKVISMFNLSDLVNFLEQQNDLKQNLEKIKAYRLQYGVDV